MSEENKNEPQANSNETPGNSSEPQVALNPSVNLASVAWYAILTAVILAILYLILLWLGIIDGQPTVTYFAEDQIVITGTPADITTVLDQVETTLPVTFTLVDPQNDSEKIPDFLRSDDNSLEEVQSQTQVSDRDSNGKLFLQIADTNVFLYRITFLDEETTLTDVVDAVQAEGQSQNVASDLNYVIGRAPLEVEGDPDCSEGFAIAEKDDITQADAEKLFQDQWAFENIKLSLVPQGVQGDGVWIALFDTSPFDLRGERLLDTDPPVIDFGNDVVNHFEIISDPDARDHGIYGASLINEIAPGTDIRFYRVLDQSNRGDLFTLLRALKALQSNWKEAGQPPLVINMSLGVHPPADSEDVEELNTLETILNDFYKAGAVIVAASGNDSAESYRDNGNRLDPIGMQKPAAYPMVIGVGASNHLNEYACFSNAGDILAPGGDNGVVNGEDCMSVVPSCADDPEHSNCLIGYVYTPNDAHYAYWTGTSFAAPMVSGAAALLLGQGIENIDVYRILAPHLAEQIEGASGEIDTPAKPPVLDLTIIVNLDE